MILEPPNGNVLGVAVAGVDLDTAVATVIDAARDRRPLGVTAVAVHGVMEAVQDPRFQYQLNDLEMVVADGQPVRWALAWLHGIRLPDRVAGPDLMQAVCQLAAPEGLGIFLYGSTERTLEALQIGLDRDIPDLVVSGTQTSRFRPASESEREADLAKIRGSGASIVFVGLGCPRQEVWTYENRLQLSMPVIAVGAAFDYHAGLLRRSPRWMGKVGLEWVHRLAQEPHRLAGRYLRLNPAFVASLVLQKLGLRRYSYERASPPTDLSRPS